MQIFEVHAFGPPSSEVAAAPLSVDGGGGKLKIEPSPPLELELEPDPESSAAVTVASSEPVGVTLPESSDSVPIPLDEQVVHESSPDDEDDEVEVVPPPSGEKFSGPLLPLTAHPTMARLARPALAMRNPMRD